MERGSTGGDDTVQCMYGDESLQRGPGLCDGAWADLLEWHTVGA